MNPLLRDLHTKFDSIPFDEIKTEHFLPALKEAIDSSKKEIESIKSSSESPGFNNTIERLERADSKLNWIAGIIFNLNSANTNDALQEVAKESSSILASYSNDILLDQELFEKIEEVYKNTDFSTLNAEEKTLLEKTYKSFVRNGAKLSPEDKSQLREIDQELSQLTVTFGENVMKDAQGFSFEIEEEEKLEGIPASALEAAAQLAESQGKKGSWVFTLDYPSYIPFVTYAKDRLLRKKMYLAFAKRGFNGNDFDNREVVKKIASLRKKRALLLGYSSHAAFVLEERMAKSAEKVEVFLSELKEYAYPVAKKELKELEEFAKKEDGIDQLERWDVAFYIEKLKQKTFNFDEEELRPYFQLENVIKGVFEVAKKLYNLSFDKLDDISVYHEDVDVYEVKEEGKHVGLLYLDFFPRKGKKDGAWMTVFRNQKIENEDNVRPHISVVCNFTKPTKTKPSLLTFNEVLTLFHEFGHALHGLLANSTYSSLSGTSVLWDFVELPSQIMENWAYEKECLDLFAKHYEDGGAIPMELIQKIRQAATFFSGYYNLRQISFGMLDLAWHSALVTGGEDVEAFEKKALTNVDLLPPVENVTMSCAFSHIFYGGYSAGYYSYKWAEILEADAFESFKEAGIFDTQVASKLKSEILSAGGNEHPSIIYKRFKGKDPSMDAFLKREGLVEGKGHEV